MNIDNLTIGELKELQNLFNLRAINEVANAHPYNIGKNYLIRTVTMTIFGQLVAVHNQELVMKDAAWIADTGRFHDAMVDGSFDQIEPFPDGEMIIGRGSVVDAVELLLPLERNQR